MGWIGEKMNILSWILSATSAIMLIAMGNKYKYAPMIGIFNQVLWIIYTVATKQWGLLPGVIIYLIVHIRNHRKWTKK
jgi:hypothetical protein